MATTDDSTQKNNKVLYGIIGVLSALVLILGFMLIKEKGENKELYTTNETINVERNDLQEELSGMLEQYDAITVDLNWNILEPLLSGHKTIQILTSK